MTHHPRILISLIIAGMFLLAGILLCLPQPRSAQAQGITPTNTMLRRRGPTPTYNPPLDLFWEPPVLLFTSKEDIQTPNLTTDVEGNLYLFWKVRGPVNEQGTQEPDLLYYSQKKSTAGWSDPVAIFSSTAISNPTAVVDAFGTIHLFWGGENTRLTYAHALVSEAGSARGWSEPLAFDTMNAAAHAAIDRQNVLYVVYPGSQSRGVYIMRSRDGGQRWDAPVNIYPTRRPGTSADYPRLVISAGGTLHVVWTEYQLPSGWPPTGIYYARSADGGQTWTGHARISPENYDQANLALVNEQEIHIAYNAISTVGGRYHRWSDDGGKSWSVTDTLTALGGTEGVPQMIVDSVGTLHILTTYRGCANYYTWRENQWSEATCLLRQPAANANSANHLLVEEPAMGITRGSHLHAVFFRARRQLWYREIALPNALMGGLELFQTPPAAVTPAPTAPVPLAAITNTVVAPAVLNGEIHARGPLDTLAADLLPALLVLCGGTGVALLLRAWSSRTSRR